MVCVFARRFYNCGDSGLTGALGGLLSLCAGQAVWTAGRFSKHKMGFIECKVPMFTEVKVHDFA